MNRREFWQSGLSVIAGGALLAPLSGCNSSWMDSAEADAQTATIVLQSVLAVVAVAQSNGQIPADVADKIRQGAQVAQTGLNSLTSLIADYKTSPNDTVLGRIGNILNQLASALPSILDGILIVSQQARTAITAGLSLLISIVAALEIIVPSLQTGAAQARVKVAPRIKSGDVVLPSREVVVSLYNAVLVQNGYAEQQIQ